ncbi:MAG: cytidyltransferase [Acidimicrobiia bacterium]|nr:cytidyltransferase [Acidimicrobiia bacterium]
MDDFGCVTGRLQPMHLDHLDLFRTVLARHEHLIVAVTNPDPTARIAHPQHDSRHLGDDNPFTYYERQAFVRAALVADGIASGRFEIVPFPLHSADLVEQYVPLGVTQYVRVFAPWEESKAEMLRSYGYHVVVLPGDAAARRSGRDVRAALRSASEWRHLLPRSVATGVEQSLALKPLSERTGP